jgi:(R,R)-butanediol dehydrogenase/meso-butanediol dehydrogenase/diacetyl reductase
MVGREMRAAVYHGREDLRLEVVPEPMVGPGELKLRVLYAGICGSDLHEYYHGPVFSSRSGHPLTGTKIPVILGHELSGEVVDVGAGSEGFEIGDLVSVDPLETCGNCVPCRAGRPTLCPIRAAHGYGRDGGGFSEFTTVRASMAHRLGPDVGAREGSLVEPMAVGMHAIRRLEVEPGDLVAVHGFGPIGLGAALGLKAMGMRVVAVDPSALRLGVAERLGVDEVIDPTAVRVADAMAGLTSGRGAAASIEAAGVPAALEAAMEATAIDGTVVVVSFPLRPIELSVATFRRAEVRVTASVSAAAADHEEVIKLMAKGAYPLEDWVTEIELDHILDGGFKALQQQEAVKVMVRIGAPALRPA